MEQLRFRCLYNILCALLVLASTAAKSPAQTGVPPGIFQDTVFHSVKLTSDIIYGSNFNHFFDTEDTLTLDTYEPDTALDYKRPLLIYCHGGGFTSGDKTTDKAKVFGDYFSKCGYLVASINYRLMKDNLLDTIDNYQGVYQATQDAKSAVRFFKQYANNYCVDTNAIFLIGTSAGASICLTAAYWNQPEADAVFSTAEFGTLENSSGNEGYSSQFNSLVSCWGGLPDTAWLRGETEPNQLFHGNLDPTVPYTSGFNPDGIYIFGSKTIEDACNRDGIETHLHTFWGASHGVGENSPQFDTLETISKDFLFNHLPANEGHISCDSNQVIVDSIPVSMSLYPNPNDGYFFINSPNIFTEYTATLSVVNVAGQVIRTASITLPANSVSEFNYSDLPAGVYLLQLKSSSLTNVFKLVIHRQ